MGGKGGGEELNGDNKKEEQSEGLKRAIDSLDWEDYLLAPLYRLIIGKIYTFTELNTQVTLKDAIQGLKFLNIKEEFLISAINKIKVPNVTD